MSSRRVALLAAALSALACGTRQSGLQQAPATVTPSKIGVCSELECPWLRLPGACATAALSLGLTGPFVEVMILDPTPGTTTVTTGGATFSLTLSGDAMLFDWTATTPVDFVIASGDGGGNAYVYDPATATSDTALEAFNAILGNPVTSATFCYRAPPSPSDALTVSKTATASFTRTWDWKIAKSSPTSSVSLAVGATFDAAYTVTVAANATDSGWIVSGQITIANNTSVDATGVQVIDSYGGTTVVPSCPDGFDGTIVASTAVTCTYTVPISGAFDGTNVATVTTTGPVGGGTATAEVAFGAPTTIVDECVSVIDDHVAGVLTTACAAASPTEVSYKLPIGPYATCDATGLGTTFVNTASFTAPSGASGSASWTVTVKVPCVSSGCTLTQGYWKTHSKEGPAPYDSRWGNIGVLEEDTIFFKSEMTWLQVFRTPVRGNPYFSLAHQYMAAKLNVLAGADASALGSALSTSEAFFAASLPTTPLTPAQRATLLNLATLLDDFNNGRIGPGHCEDRGDDGKDDGDGSGSCGGEDGHSDADGGLGKPSGDWRGPKAATPRAWNRFF